MMSEEQIERRAEVMTDSLDRRFLTSTMTQDAYDAESALIALWVTNQTALAKAEGARS